MTGLSLPVGKPLQAGTAVMEIDGQPIFGYSGKTPFYRDLVAGDKGSDVETLKMFLQVLHLLPEDFDFDGSFNFEIAHALTEFQSANGMTTDGIMKKDGFIFIPESFQTVASLEVSVGSPIPADGIVATGAGPVSKVELLAVGEEDRPTGFQPEEELALGNEAVSTSISAMRVTGEEAQTLGSALDSWTHEGIAEVSEGEGQTLIYSGLQVFLREPQNFGTVPSSAILAGSEGTLCVVESGTKQGLVAAKVEAISVPGDIGVTGVGKEFIGKKVLRDARFAENKGVSCQ
ncbi:MAG: peptidoglycan-binding domain-containing protein [Leucobacter sp.]